MVTLFARYQVICEIKAPRFKRQRFLLDFIGQIGKRVSATDMQKLLFLHMQEQKSTMYEFIPYKFGCYSFTLDADIKVLKQERFLLDSDSIQMMNYSPSNTNYLIVRERGNDLLAKVYYEYPDYAINSEVKHKILSSHGLSIVEEIKNKLSKKNEQVLFTIGYEGRSIEHFINILIRNNIRVLCDVRNTPFSHKFGFSKKILYHITKEVNIQYSHFPELGIESAKRQTLYDISDYEQLFNEYAKRVVTQTEHLDQLQSLIDSHRRIALMCFEHEPEKCHRHKIRDIFKNKGIVCEDL